MSFVWLKMDGSLEEIDASQVERICSQGYIVKSWKEMFEDCSIAENSRISCLESEKSQLIEVVRELVAVAQYYCGGKKGCNYQFERPHVYRTIPLEDCDQENENHSDRYPMTVAGKRAREALTKHKEILNRYGVNN